MFQMWHGGYLREPQVRLDGWLGFRRWIGILWRVFSHADSGKEREANQHSI